MLRFTMRALITVAFAIALSTPVRGPLVTSAISAGGALVDPAIHTPHPQTRADLAQSMRGEAFANASYRLYAEQARREGLPSVARLFESAASVERDEHFRKEAALSGLPGSDAANLRDAMAGETYESQKMYPGFAQRAKIDGDTDAAVLFSEITRDESTHGQAFGTALSVVEVGRGSVPTPPRVDTVRVPAGSPQVHAQQTKANLDTAMHGEALAYAKYRLYAEHAKNPAVARLFRGNADVELQEHFAEEARLAGLVGTTRSNLNNAIAGERYESQTMYPTFAKHAKAAGDTEAARVFLHNASDQAGHARAFQQARDRLP